MDIIKPPLKAAIIGYGKVGRIRNKCIQDHPDLELIGVCDINPELCIDSEAPYYSDYKKLLDEDPDLVFICTYNSDIPKISIEAISRGIHVFTEKPPGRTLDDVKKIYDASKRNPKVKIKFGFNHRYHEAVMDAKAIVEKEQLGKIMWLRGVYGKAGGPGFDNNWRNDKSISGGGILIDQGIHMLDLFRYFCGEFEEVKSFVGRSFWSIDVEDNVFAILRSNTSGQTAMIHSSATQWRHKFLLEIYMERGYLEIDGILSSTQTYGKETLKIAFCMNDENGYPMPNPSETMTYYENDQSWFAEINEFVECLIGNKSVSNGGVEDAVKTMELVHTIYNEDKKWKSFNNASEERIKQ